MAAPSSTGSDLAFFDAPEVEFILELDPAELPDAAAVPSPLSTCTAGAAADCVATAAA